MAANSMRGDNYVPMVQIEPPNAQDNEEWRRIHKDKPQLSTFSAGRHTIKFQGWAMKRGEKKALGGGWAKRYWILTPAFAVYFKSDNGNEKSAGCVYLKACELRLFEQEDGQKNVIQIMPKVPRRPGESLLGDAPHFWMAIPDQSQYESWLEFLKTRTGSFQAKAQLLHADHKDESKETAEPPPAAAE
eukprot:NODE_946_length_1103_cov_76.802254_g902_i0.p1 GENE.NODE_946_length_1103_cov_76.802254_g902_i0~~NODE_946_length_1103_cov_76.802254_g902_i0.p1  ORF type:complete len:188 (-),score=19.39 NODE_946_length_1103_cov_76.802254_g902_i0:132-695(-)